MSNVGYATLSVIPSARGFGSALSRDIDPQMHAPGMSAGKVLAGGLLAGAAVVVAGLGAVIKTGIGEAMDASAGTAQLAAGIASTGNAANVSVDGLNALASSIQGYSGQTDDSIVASQQLLLTFTNIKNGVGAGNDIFDQATKATANMAAKMGGDAAGSAVMLGKALNDPIKGMATLGRAGVQFTDAQKDTIKALVESGDTMGAQKVILGELETQFGGAAAAAGKSLPGQLEIAKRSFEDVSQSVAEGLLPMILPGLTSIGTTITSKVIPAITGFIQGFKDGEGPGGKFREILGRVGDVASVIYETFQTRVLPVLQTVAGFITGTVVPGIASFVGWLKENAAWLTPIAVGIGAMVIAFQAYQAVLLVVRIATAAFAVVQGILNVVLSANPIGIVVLAIVGLVAALVYAWNNSETFRNIVTGVWEAIKGAVLAVVDWFRTAVPAAFAFIKDAFLRYTPLGLIISHWDQIKSAVGNAITGAIDFVKGFPGRVVSAIGNLGSLLYDSGKNLIQGLLDGAGSLLSKIGSFFLDKVPAFIREPFKRALGINSPSKVFAGYGANIAQGVILGVGSMQSQLDDSMAGLVSTPSMSSPDFPGRNVNRGGTTGAVVNQYITTSDPEAAGLAGLRRMQALGA